VVRAVYRQFLRREPDGSGLSYWVTLLGGGSTKEEVAAQITGSPEYVQVWGGGSNAGFLSRLYLDVLHRPIDLSGQEGWGRALASGASHAEVARAIFSSDEFRQHLLHFPAYLDREESFLQPYLLHGFYQRLLHRDADPGGLIYWVEALRRGVRGEEVIASMAGSDEYYSRL
jgi:hypothetical protein